jgi:LysM repeat protein
MLRRFLPLAGLCLILSAAGPLGAQTPPAPENLESGWHIVRPGDTLEDLASRYLGSSQLWKRLAELNRDILDPDRIEPGQRVRVLIPMRGPLPVARIDRISRKVEEQPQPNPWNEARSGDLLVEKDAVRTYRASSAVMDFRDGTSLMVTEDSLVILNRASNRLKGAPTHTVEIVEGQADVEVGIPRMASAEAARPEVEIVLGNTRARSKPAATGGSQSRARKAEGGGAKVMIYGGEGEVEAGGSKVQVPQGMGTSVEKEGPPGPPEPLLPAPRLTYPATGAVAVCANPRLAWEAVPESVSYTVEVCRDPACAELVERAVGVDNTEWRASALPDGTAGEYHWRVTARSRSGLDGYPSATFRVVIRPGEADLAAPSGTIRITGTTVRIGDKLYVPPAVGLDVQAADGGSGLSGWQPVIDGKETAMAAWKGPWTNGPHTAGVTALDLCGNRGPIAPVSFIVDAEPPTLSWRPEGPPREQFRSRHGMRLRRGKPGDTPGLIWAPSDPTARLRWDDKWPAAPAGTLHQSAEVRSDVPTIFVRLEGVRLLSEGKPLPTGDGGVIRFDAADSGSRVIRLTLRTRSTAGGPVLEVEAEDGVGNTSRQELKIERAAL